MLPATSASRGAVRMPLPTRSTKRTASTQPQITGWMLVVHVLVVTIISNIGKMFPAFVYRKEAHRRERLAVAVGMWPRGEVGAGIIIISPGYGLGGPIASVSILSLALNLKLTGVFIFVVKRLIADVPVDFKPAEAK